MLDLVVDFAFMLLSDEEKEARKQFKYKNNNEDSRSNRETFRKGCR